MIFFGICIIRIYNMAENFSEINLCLQKKIFFTQSGPRPSKKGETLGIQNFGQKYFSIVTTNTQVLTRNGSKVSSLCLGRYLPMPLLFGIYTRSRTVIILPRIRFQFKHRTSKTLNSFPEWILSGSLYLCNFLGHTL